MADRDDSQGERRRGALETAEALGHLSGLVEGYGRRIDAMHGENLSRHTEVIARIADVQAQVHEVKHSANNNHTMVIALGEKMIAHQEQDKADHAYQTARLEENRVVAETGIAELAKEIKENRASANRNFADLFSWRNRIYGAMALVGLIGMIFGKQIGTWVVQLFTQK